jgi:hypothetical protein
MLSKQVAYFDNRAFGPESLEAIITMGIPRLNEYIKTRVRPLLPSFAKAFLGGAFTCSMNRTFSAGSMNRMLKFGMDGRRRSLLGACNSFANRLVRDRQNLLHHLANRHCGPTNWDHILDAAIESEMGEKPEPLFTHRPDYELGATTRTRSCRIQDRPLISSIGCSTLR